MTNTWLLAQILKEETDINHPLTLKEIAALYKEKAGITFINEQTISSTINNIKNIEPHISINYVPEKGYYIDQEKQASAIASTIKEMLGEKEKIINVDEVIAELISPLSKYQKQTIIEKYKLDIKTIIGPTTLEIFLNSIKKYLVDITTNNEKYIGIPLSLNARTFYFKVISFEENSFKIVHGKLSDIKEIKILTDEYIKENNLPDVSHFLKEVIKKEEESRLAFKDTDEKDSMGFVFKGELPKQDFCYIYLDEYHHYFYSYSPNKLDKEDFEKSLEQLFFNLTPNERAIIFIDKNVSIDNFLTFNENPVKFQDFINKFTRLLQGFSKANTLSFRKHDALVALSYIVKASRELQFSGKKNILIKLVNSLKSIKMPEEIYNSLICTIYSYDFDEITRSHFLNNDTFKA